MIDGDPGLDADGRETHLQLGALIGGHVAVTRAVMAQFKWSVSLG